MIPPDDKKREIEMEWLRTPIGNGIYSLKKSLRIDELFLIGKCNENGRKMIFLTQMGGNIGSYNSVLFVEVISYIVCKYDREQIDRISFSSLEIDCIHPVNQAFECTMDNGGLGKASGRDFDFHRRKSSHRKWNNQSFTGDGKGSNGI